MKSTADRCRKATAIFLTACSLSACAIPVRIDADCAWSKPIRFSEATKTWLAERVPWPGYALRPTCCLALLADRLRPRPRVSLHTNGLGPRLFCRPLRTALKLLPFCITSFHGPGARLISSFRCDQRFA